MSESGKKIVIISGATACGKSQLALDFGEKKDIAIINCDSLQIYQGLPILSAQPSKEEQKLIPHFLYSHLKPDESASVGLWLELIKNLIPEIWRQNKIPVIVGGSGMYISKLIDGISKMPEVSLKNRQKAFEIYLEIGHQKFQEKFGEDKLIDKQRLLRACEIYLQTGKSISFWQAQIPEKIFPNAKFLHLNLEILREKLYQNCNLRFAKMLEIGVLDEVEHFLKLNSKNNFPIYKTLGFTEIALFLQNEISKEEMLDIATQKTRNYAKRQLTYFRNQFENKISFENSKVALDFLTKQT